MTRIIVTPGNSYTDIDGLACAIAYAELLRNNGKDAIAVCSGPLNSTVPDFLKSIAHTYSHLDISGDSYVLVDVSDKKFIELIIPIESVIEVFDHHFGYEDFWKTQLGSKSRIEPIGAAATLIWEEWKSSGKSESISHESATLLAHAILSNTVNFQLSLTHERDRIALSELEVMLDLRSGWRESYFSLQQDLIENDPIKAIRYDMKVIGSYAFGQLEIWESHSFVKNIHFENIFHEMGYEQWIINIVDISRGISIIQSNQDSFLESIGKNTNAVKDKNILTLPKLMLRKELLRFL
ncbi:DHH family phosphoesterase [Candidatus Gracilibacteria bacterium]|nr:DHH family phosphoesterase [Candidatus Gracilibacteria bacterium]